MDARPNISTAYLYFKTVIALLVNIIWVCWTIMRDICDGEFLVPSYKNNAVKFLIGWI